MCKMRDELRWLLPFLNLLLAFKSTPFPCLPTSQGPAAAQAIAVTTAHVLWHLSSDVGVRALMHQHTPMLGKALFGTRL